MNNNNNQFNPMDIIQMIKEGKNPQQIMLNFLESRMGQNNPIAANLISLAKQNKTEEIEKIARNLCAQRGINFDKEFNDFKSNLFKAINSKK